MEVRNYMKRNKILIIATTLIVLLSISSFFAVSQAWELRKPNKEYVGYDLKAVYGSVTITSLDASGAPELIIIEHSVQSAVEATITIANKVYVYPDDFEIAVTHHIEFNALTGEGLVRTAGEFTFKAPSKPTLMFWGVAQITGLWQTPEGTLINPEDFRGKGQFELTGTRLFNKVEGFGLGDTIFYPPEYTNQYVHQMGYIKGWPL
jgi:hypothetical protein